jgi:hypothetical protein
MIDGTIFEDLDHGSRASAIQVSCNAMRPHQALGGIPKAFPTALIVDGPTHRDQRIAQHPHDGADVVARPRGAGHGRSPQR